ncbi:hypothetical protein B0H14DRAFT_3469497 [Mycena olivaceomarginata]|nr:hypothetical protein B0H14DRAFT_3469497 [Mycena olivaceomarginata]
MTYMGDEAGLPGLPLSGAYRRKEVKRWRSKFVDSAWNAGVSTTDTWSGSGKTGAKGCLGWLRGAFGSGRRGHARCDGRTLRARSDEEDEGDMDAIVDAFENIVRIAHDVEAAA